MGTTRPGTWGLYQPALSDLVKPASNDFPKMLKSVEDALALERTLAASDATDMVTAKITNNELVAGTDPRLPRLVGSDDDSIALVVDSVGNKTFLDARAADGAPTDNSARLIGARLTDLGIVTGGAGSYVPELVGVPDGEVLRGTGSPYGVLTPSAPGQEYTDTAGTCGAWRWMATGTTKTSWVVMTGDTGWRNVVSLMNPLLEYPIARLRREGPNCLLYFQAKIPDSGFSSGDTAIAIPAYGSGFSPPIQMYVNTGYVDSGPAVLQAYGDVALYSVKPRATGRWTINWMTSDPWPTTLPGTPA